MSNKFSLVITVLLVLSISFFVAGKCCACSTPPVAVLDADPVHVSVGQTVTLDGSDSYDPDGEIVKCEWDWTNNDSYDYSESPGDKRATHSYNSPGAYTVKLRVVDDTEQTDTDTCLVYVYSDPVAILTANSEHASVDVNIIFDGSDSSDSDGNIIKYEWDFEPDGTYDYYETADCCDDGAFDGNTPHFYNKQGRYIVTLRVTDDDDRTDTDSYSIFVNGVYYVDADANAGGDGTSWETAFDNFDSALGTVVNGDEIWVAEGTYKPTDRINVNSDLISRWKLDEGQGTIVCNSHGNDYGTLTGDPNWVAGKIGDFALDFDGCDDYIRVPFGNGSVYDFGCSNFTLAIWFKTNSNTAGTLIASPGSYPTLNDYYRLDMLSNGKLYFKYSTGDIQTMTSSLQYNDDEWHFAVAVRDGYRTGKLYVNANLAAEDTNNSGDYTSIDVKADLYIGSYSSSSNYFEGLVDDVRVYKESLSEQKVQGLYNNERLSTFKLIEEVAIYGGFAGYGVLDPNVRDWTKYPTILSGDINEPNDVNDNCYHVVAGADNALLDGFIIKCGNANDVNEDSCGAGLYNDNTSPDVNNCVFVDNLAKSDGGAIYNDGNTANPTIKNCLFVDNDANCGGAIYDNNSSPTLINCTLSGNNADDDGGGMYNYGTSSTPKVTNCIFDDNYAKYGGGMYNTGSSTTVTDCEFTDNTAVYWGGGMENNSSSSPTITRCIFAGNAVTATNYGGGAIYCCSSSNANIVNCTISKNTAANGYAGGLYSYASSPTISNTIFWNNTDGYSDYDLAAASSGTITINYSDVTFSYYYSGTGDRTMSYCISVDPLFADAANDDFHLKSKDGRWDPVAQSWWDTDTVFSRCLVGGDPSSDYSNEPTPNGGNINMGAHGNTPYASKLAPASTGSLTVVIQPQGAINAGAKWKLNYEIDEFWRDSGTAEDLVPGNYRVTFKSVQDWSKPDDITGIEVVAGQTTGPIYADYVYMIKYVSGSGHDYWPGTIGQPYRSIQKGVDEVPEGGTVYVIGGAGTFNHVVFPNKALTLTGQSNPVVSGSNIYTVFTLTNITKSITIENLTLENGKDTLGGGMYIFNSSPTVRYCTFQNNQAYNSSGDAYGGGLCLDNAGGTIEHCYFYNNLADGWYGIYRIAGYGGAVFAYNSTTTLSYCEFGEPPDDDDAYTQTITSGVSEELLTWTDAGASLVPTYNNCKVRGGLSGSGQNDLDGPYHDYLGYKPSGSGNSDF